MSNEQMIRRREKLDMMQSRGIPWHPESFHTNYELNEAAMLEDGISNVQVAGRVMSIRHFSKLCFITISNIQGSLQLLLKKEEVVGESFHQFHANLIKNVVTQFNIDNFRGLLV